MLTIGNAKLSKERLKAFQAGGIICVIQSDKVRRLWHGIGADRDLMAAEIVAEDGCRWVMGRVRVHKDDKMFGSADEKHAIALGIGSDVNDADEFTGGAVIVFGASLEVDGVVEIDAGMCDVDGLQRLIESVTNATGGRMSSVVIDKKIDK